MTRTENSTKNMFTGLLSQILLLIFRFVTRTVFIQCLGSEYLGINGLFSNILNLLSLADLGIGASLIYNLYEPIEKDDKERQKIIIQYLKKVYFIIGIIILLIGIILLPFLKYIIKEPVDFINLNVVFLIYVFQTASTYLFFSSKVEFLCAHQKRYIYNNILNIITIISNIAQIIVLFIFKNFILYLITIIVFNIFQAYLVARKTNKMYPYIIKKASNSLTKKEKKEIFKDCGSLMIYRVNYVVLTATDNIIISKYIGLSTVGLYSNYVLVVNSIVNILATFFDSITASLGSLHASKDKDKDYFVFKMTNFLTFVCFGIFAIGVFILINGFITIWLGKEYLLSTSLVLIISINLYIEGIRKFLSTYRSSYGLFRQAKFMPLFGMIVNIVISIFLVQKIGIFGVLLGTLISNMVSFMWYDPYIIYKNIFKKNVFEYFVKNILYVLFIIIVGFLCYYLCDIIAIEGIIGFIIHGIICISIPIILITILYWKTEYGEYLKYTIKNIYNKLIGRVKK